VEKVTLPELARMKALASDRHGDGLHYPPRGWRGGVDVVPVGRLGHDRASVEPHPDGMTEMLVLAAAVLPRPVHASRWRSQVVRGSDEPAIENAVRSMAGRDA
jgi:hypothetical protein